jgi:hypothetical protein
MRQSKTIRAASIRPDGTRLEVNFHANGQQNAAWRGTWIPFKSFLPGVPLEAAQRVKLDETGRTLVWPDGVLSQMSVQQAIMMAFQLPWPGGNTRGKGRSPRKQLPVYKLKPDDYGAGLRIMFENQAVISFSIYALPGAERILKKDKICAYVDKQTGTYLKWQGVPGLKLKITTLIKELLGFPKIGAAGGRAGGKSKSERKVMAAQSNGVKGGRPKKPRIRESVHEPYTAQSKKHQLERLLSEIIES